MEAAVVNAETELRKLPAMYLFRLAELLEFGNAWKELMARIPCEMSPNHLKYKVEHMSLIEDASEKYHRRCSDILLDEWGTSGRRRPTVALLLELLTTAELFRVAEFVAVEVLRGVPPQRPSDGPASAVDTSTDVIEKLIPNLQCLPSSLDIHPEAQNVGALMSSTNLGLNTLVEAVNGMCVSIEDQVTVQVGDENGLDRLAPVDAGNGARRAENISLNTRLPCMPYEELVRITDRFSDVSIKSNGRKLGVGAFGTVYLGIMVNGQKVAVKRLHDDAINAEIQFQTEVEVLSKFRHENLLPLLGYSCDGPSCCLVYAFITNGSLQERLACQDETPPLSWESRIRIAIGSARGLVHLHTSDSRPLVHRDVKSANILLDENFVPKLGDFGLVRMGSSGQNTKSVALTSTVFGTSAYMAPEAFRGDVSVKLDTFSFGVVLLELMTALPPYDENREGCDLVTHLEESCEDGDITEVVDGKAGDWGGQSFLLARVLYDVAQTCLEEKRQRPTMLAVLQSLEAQCPPL